MLPIEQCMAGDRLQLKILMNCLKKSNTCNQVDSIWYLPYFLLVVFILLIRLQTVVLSMPSRRAISLWLPLHSINSVLNSSSVIFRWNGK